MVDFEEFPRSPAEETDTSTAPSLGVSDFIDLYGSSDRRLFVGELIPTHPSVTARQELHALYQPCALREMMVWSHPWLNLRRSTCRRQVDVATAELPSNSTVCFRVSERWGYLTAYPSSAFNAFTIIPTILNRPFVFSYRTWGDLRTPFGRSSI